MTLFTKKGKENMTLAEVTAILAELRLPTALVFTPTNLESEKQKFFDSTTYSPNFTYKIVDNKNKKYLGLLDSLTTITDIDPRLSDFYIQIVDAKRGADRLMNAVGDNVEFTKIGKKRFGMPSDILFRNAARILRGNVKGYSLVEVKRSQKQKVFNFDEISELVQGMFDELGLEGWHVNASLNIAKNGMKVGGIKKKEFLMDGNITRKAFDLKKSLVHEFTHIIRAHNGALSGYEGLAKPNIPSYLDAEEGLALYSQELFDVYKLSDLKKSAAKAWAIYLGEELAFRELYNIALSFLPPKQSFELVYRVKRGLGDTSMPGLYPKDVAYFRGFRRVRKKCRNDRNYYDKLFAGKIGFNQIKWVDEGLLQKPELVPTKKMYEKLFKKVGI